MYFMHFPQGNKLTKDLQTFNTIYGKRGVIAKEGTLHVWYISRVLTDDIQTVYDYYIILFLMETIGRLIAEWYDSINDYFISHNMHIHIMDTEKP